MALLDTRRLTCSYVVLNNPSMASGEEPQFTPNFVSTLFDLPQTTAVSPGPEGMVISAPGNKAPRIFSFSPMKLQIQNDTPQLVQQTTERVLVHFRKVGFTINPRAYGLNYELDFKVSGADDAETWLARRFATSGLKNLGQSTVALQSMTLKFTSYGKLQTLKLEPRIGETDRLFAYVNMNFDESRLLRGEQLEGEMENWFEKAKSMLAQLLEE